MLATRIGSPESPQEKVLASEIVYLAYRNREIFFSTQQGSYVIRCSLSSFLENLPLYIVQTTKNSAVNIYYVRKFSVQLNGNLVLWLATGNKQVVSRRYVKALKDAFYTILDQTPSIKREP